MNFIELNLYLLGGLGSVVVLHGVCHLSYHHFVFQLCHTLQELEMSRTPRA